MKKTLVRIIISAFLVIIILMASGVVCSAEGYSLVLKIKSTSVELGAPFRVVIAVSNMPDLQSFKTSMTYDKDLFTYVETKQPEDKNIANFGSSAVGNTITIQSYNSEINFTQSTYLVLVYFEAKKLGTGSFNLTSADGFSSNGTDEIEVSYDSSLSVTVTEPAIQSGNNNLKSLEIEPGTLEPAFSASQTSYSTQVTSDVSKLTVSAVPEDGTATVSVSDTSLVDGANQITIVVTAENGDVKTYTIKVTRGEPTPSPSPSPSPSPVPTPAVTVELPDGTYAILDAPPDVPIPAGFYRSMVIMSEKMVSVYKALKGDLTLYYLSSEGGKSGFYYYDSQSAAYKPFAVLTLPAQSYSVLSPESGTDIPEGFSETTINLGGQDLAAWKKAAGQQDGQYLLYLMNSQGDKAFYIYDQSLQLLALYSTNSTDSTTETPTSETTAADPENEPAPAGPWRLIALLLGLLCLLLTGLAIWLAIRIRNSGGGPDDNHKKSGSDRDDPDDGPQLPLPKAPTIRRVE